MSGRHLCLTAAQHFKLNLDKTELFILGIDCPCMYLSVTVKDVMVSPSSTTRNLGVILDDRLSCAPNITAVARSCRFALYSKHRIWSFLTKVTTQLLVQALFISQLDYLLLAGLPASSTKLLQGIQNAAACLVFNLPKFSHVTPSLCDLHCLSVAACIQFKMMLLAFKAINRTEPVSLQTLHLSTSKHCSDHTPYGEHFALLH